jgi:hypothetical protein
MVPKLCYVTSGFLLANRERGLGDVRKLERCDLLPKLLYYLKQDKKHLASLSRTEAEAFSKNRAPDVAPPLLETMLK